MSEPVANGTPQLNNPETALIRMENITKRFPGVVANKGVHLYVQPGTFHAVIGENGAGKSTLLNILYGRYKPDQGRVWIRGEEVTDSLHSPADAIRRGVGLVSQHYALIPALTLIENVMLGSEHALPGGILNRKTAQEHALRLAEQLGLGALPFHVRADSLSVAAQQKVEILKALYRGAQILLLDEPTATLAPQEADALFALLQTLTARGATIIFVTHKLREVRQYSHAVTVLRAGRNVGDFVTAETDESLLLQRMIGTRSNSPINTRVDLAGNLTASASIYESAQSPLTAPYVPHPPTTSPLFQIENVTIMNSRKAAAVQNVSLDLRIGEILGIAGVDGSGQRELAEALIGTRSIKSGKIYLAGRELTSLNVRQRQKLGVASIPEDRHRNAMILDFDLGENFLLGHERRKEWGGGNVLSRQRILGLTTEMIRRYDVRAGSMGAPTLARNLSGGNQQKVVVARAMESQPRLLIASQPTRGLDVNASEFVYRTLFAAKEKGLGVLLFSLDLDEVIRLSDRIAVMFNGRIVGILPKAEATPERIGALMTGTGEEPNPPTEPATGGDAL
jgi:general nucleoside transport system ATP-binding protein